MTNNPLPLSFVTIHENFKPAYNHELKDHLFEMGLKLVPALLLVKYKSMLPPTAKCGGWSERPALKPLLYFQSKNRGERMGFIPNLPVPDTTLGSHGEKPWLEMDDASYELAISAMFPLALERFERCVRGSILIESKPITYGVMHSTFVDQDENIVFEEPGNGVFLDYVDPLQVQPAMIRSTAQDYWANSFDLLLSPQYAANEVLFDILDFCLENPGEDIPPVCLSPMRRQTD